MALTDEQEADLANRFSFHPATEKTGPQHEHIRGVFYSTALHIAECVPAGREQALALTAIETAMFWANAAIARHS